MTTGWSAGVANANLDSLGSTYPWIQLHTGAPGPNGTANVAANSVRQQASFAAASAGSKATNADLAWTNVAGTEQYAYYTQWSLASGGTFGGSGVITANPVTAGDNYAISAGSFVLSVPIAS